MYHCFQEGVLKLTHLVGLICPIGHVSQIDLLSLLSCRTILSRPVCCHFSFSGGQTGKLKVIEEMAECVFNLQIPIELL